VNFRFRKQKGGYKKEVDSSKEKRKKESQFNLGA